MTASRLDGFGTTIFTEMSALAERTGAINLGQGFPDEDGPAEILEAAAAAMRAGHNQYAPLAGVPALREAVAAHQQRFWGLAVDHLRSDLPFWDHPRVPAFRQTLPHRDGTDGFFIARLRRT